jgi:hypothetical protein
VRSVWPLVEGPEGGHDDDPDGVRYGASLPGMNAFCLYAAPSHLVGITSGDEWYVSAPS